MLLACNWGVDLIEDTTITEELWLSFLPSAEIVNGGQLDLGEAGDILRLCQFRVERTVVVQVQEADTTSADTDEIEAAGAAYGYLDPVLAEFATLGPDDPRRRRVREELAVGFLPIVHHIARRYQGRGEPVAAGSSESRADPEPSLRRESRTTAFRRPIAPILAACLLWSCLLRREFRALRSLEFVSPFALRWR